MIANDYPKRRSHCKQCRSEQAKRRNALKKIRSIVPATERLCSRCRIIKTADQFSPSRYTSDGLSVWCKPCNKEHRSSPEYKEKRRKKNKKRYKEDPAFREQRRSAHLQYKFKLPVEDYNKQCTIQNGKCALCFEVPVSGKNLAVDHDHSCCPKGKGCKNCIRGLLCDGCNHKHLPWVEYHPHLQNDFIKQYLAQRPFLQPSFQQLHQIPRNRFG
jgi:Recombination endonuclease VII